MQNIKKNLRLNEIDLLNKDNSLTKHDRMMQKKVIYAIAMLEICKEFNVKFTEIDNDDYKNDIEQWILREFESEEFLEIWKKRCKDHK